MDPNIVFPAKIFKQKTVNTSHLTLPLLSCTLVELFPETEAQSSMFSCVLTEGADIILQTGVFVMKVGSTWSKASRGGMRAV